MLPFNRMLIVTILLLLSGGHSKSMFFNREEKGLVAFIVNPQNKNLTHIEAHVDIKPNV
jgi:hypothetical protein